MSKMKQVTPLNADALEFPHSGEPIYPQMELRETDLPSLKDKKIGDEFTLKVKVKIKSIREGRAKEIFADANLLEIGVAK